MIEIEVSDPVFRFLGGYFHQDIDSPESALDEYLEEIPKEEQENDVAALKEFINSDYSDEEKNDFIDEAADGVDILSYGASPLVWLEQVIQKIEKNIETL
ncbi:contact-dependent growth inhibition system immunity protein [Bacillus vallismortis]|uniref:Contact-dependent growth inhibition system immunity protein n=1 Tax=Bacillus vallismortis TaxID=72361 RepID=A0ABY4Y2H8_BACVA|nr:MULTISPECIES: contact-dependent growth inhibition system immunity protein [Bacillus subtilis group]MDM5301290.1 contact-dependent growth inhibition system immunity protein [Bacillus subtilis]MDM5323343.1 contact-dependent growth inhibition system immunity protein [Bacillus subtilis]USP96684.1 contact-dependent growth inhibition system immunity protein [Bacillus vallismortis]